MLVSIFIPTYNAASVVSTTVASVLAQTHRELEVVVVDDGSTDGTADVLRALAERDGRVRFLQKGHEGSVPYAWQFVWPHLRGEWTFYMSHDDLLAPDCVEHLVARAADDVDAVIPTVRFFHADMERPEDDYAEANRTGDVAARPTMTGGEAFAAMLDYSIPGFALWRTQLIRREGMPVESFNSDEAMQRLWALACRRVAFAPDAVMGYRQSAASIVKGLRPYHYGTLYTDRRLLDAARACQAVTPDRLQALHARIVRSLLYLKARYIAGRDGWSTADRQHVEATLAATETCLRRGLKGGGVALRVAASSAAAFQAAAWLYSWKFCHSHNVKS